MDPLDTIRQLIGGLTTLTAEEVGGGPALQAQANCEARESDASRSAPRPRPRKRPGT
jgi:hypothetical protein